MGPQFISLHRYELELQLACPEHFKAKFPRGTVERLNNLGPPMISREEDEPFTA
jgi:hypothetical protein